ncbi:MAG: hypothetical protein LBJ59_04595 [Zoogloeaceae bacterium]|jgi:hypothetical protein|nr:hypothetical protein [Zoogloeaceae bacterium]
MMGNEKVKVCVKHQNIVKKFVEQYLDGEIRKITTFDFQSLNYKNSSNFDADRTPIIRAIYCLLWRDKLEPEADCLFSTEIKYSGETLCTYKSAIISKYGKPFSKLDSISKNIVQKILIKYGIGFGNKIFNAATGSIVNNHQLGNFMPLSVITKDTMNAPIQPLNPVRAQNGFFDYFDLFLEDIKKFYAGKQGSTLAPKLNKQFDANHLYFKNFNSFNDYIRYNLLDDFFESSDENCNYEHMHNLSEIDFESYVRQAMKIIKKRGERILAELELKLRQT